MRIEVGSESFVFEESLEIGRFKLRCVECREDLLPLCRVVESAWAYGPEEFLKAVTRRQGQSFEGVVSFSFYAEYPEELLPGVTLGYFEDSCLVDDGFFVAFVLGFATAWLSGVRARGLVDPRVDSMLPLLDELRDGRAYSSTGRGDEGLYGPIRRGDGWEGSIGGNAPVQGEGRVDGHVWYFRARWSRWTLQIAEPLDATDAEPVGAGIAGWMAAGDVGSDYQASWMDGETAWRLVTEAFGAFRRGELRRIGANDGLL